MASITEELLILVKSMGGAAAAEDVDKVTTATKESGTAAKEAKAEHLGFGSALGSLKSIAFQTAGIVGIGGLAVGVGAAVKAAQGMQAQNAILGQSIKNNVRFPAKDATEQMDKFAESLAVKGGFGPLEGITQMTRLLAVTKDTSRAEKDLSLASDIARGTHRSLAQATRAVMMVEEGRTTGLSRMGIFLTASKTAQDALAASTGKHTAAEKEAAKAQDLNATKIQGMTKLWQQFGGTTDVYSKTSQGAISNLKNTVDVLEETLGRKLLPVITSVTQAFTGFVRQMMDGQGLGGTVVQVVKDLFTALKELWPVLAAVAAAWLLWNTYMLVTKAIGIVTMIVETASAFFALIPAITSVDDAMVLLNLTFDANPVMIVVIALAALGAALILAYNHVKWFRDFVNDAWTVIQQAFTVGVHAVSDAINWVINWLKHNWPLVVGILLGPIALAVAEIITHWKQVEALPGKLLQLFKDAGNDIANAIVWPFKWAFNWVSKHLPSFHVHHIGPIPIPLPSFPGLATGGVTPYGGAFVVGEKGPELVTLPQGASVSSQADLAQTNQLLRELILAVQNNSQALIVDGRVLAQSVMRQGLLQQSRS
jgi:hypothetical protein